MTWAIGIDPGGVHVGYATWSDGAQSDVPEGIHAEELTPGQAPDRLDLDLWDRRLGAGTVIIEEFRLYGGHTLGSQVSNKMLTSELIGALKYVCKKRRVTVIEQGASIKEPTRRQLRARGIELASLGKGGHATDAEVHLWYHLLRREGITCSQ